MKFSGKKLEKIREDNDYTQEQLASTLEVTTLLLEKWELGTVYPGKDMLLKICKVFKCSMGDLLEEDQEEEAEETAAKNGESNSNESKEQYSDNSNINFVIKSISNFMNKSYNMFYNMNFMQRIKCACEIVIEGLILLVICIILHNIVYGFIQDIIGYTTIGNRIADIIGNIFAIALTVMGAILWLKIYRIRYLDQYRDENEELNYKKRQKSKTKEANNQKSKIPNMLDKVVSIILKIIFIICMIPLFALLVGIICVIVMSVYYIQYGTIFLWTALLLLGISILVLCLINLLYKFVASKFYDLGGVFTAAIIGFIIMGVGIGATIATYMGFEEVNSFGEGDYKTATVSIPMANNIVFDGSNCEYKIDNSVNDIQIKVEYVNGATYKIDYNNVSRYKDYYISQDFGFLNTYKLVLQDLKNSKVRNYETAEYVKVIITTSQSNYDALKLNSTNLNKLQSTNNTFMGI